MHPCGHSSIKLLWSCDTRAQDSFSLLQSTQCFQNVFFYQFVHSSESIFGHSGKFHSIYPSSVYTFFQKLVMINEFFSKKNWKLSPFTSMFFFQLDNFLFSFFLPSFSFLACSFFFFSFFFFKLLSFIHFLSPFFLFLSKKIVRMGAYTTYLRLTAR